MKNSSLLLTIFLLTLFGAGCTDHPVLDPLTAKCRLTGFTGAFIDGEKVAFEYDANGRVSRHVRNFEGSDIVDYRHTYDASGRLSRSDFQYFDVNGKKLDEGVETYVWTNGRITQFKWENQSGLKGVNNLTYNAAGQLIGFTFESNDPTTDAKWAYTYDANGVLINRRITSMDGKDFLFEARLTYTTTQIVKTAFSLMAKAGQPIDPIMARPWESYYPKNDGVLAYYLPDANGQPELLAKGTLKDMTFNQSGIATGWSYGDVTGDLVPVKFQVDGCQ